MKKGEKIRQVRKERKKERGLINDTDLFHSVVLRSLGTDSGSSLQTGCRFHHSYMGWACTGLLAF